MKRLIIASLFFLGCAKEQMQPRYPTMQELCSDAGYIKKEDATQESLIQLKTFLEEEVDKAKKYTINNAPEYLERLQKQIEEIKVVIESYKQETLDERK